MKLDWKPIRSCLMSEKLRSVKWVVAHKYGGIVPEQNSPGAGPEGGGSGHVWSVIGSTCTPDRRTRPNPGKSSSVII